MKRFALCDSAGMIIAGPCPRSTDFTCNWSPDRELVVVYSPQLKVGDYIDIEKGEEVLPGAANGHWPEGLQLPESPAFEAIAQNCH